MATSVKRVSAGLLPFRITGQGALEVFLVHPGGPFWRKKDQGAWSIAKGEIDEGEDALVAAEREFKEELGAEPPSGTRLYLGEIQQSGGKVICAWAVEATAFELSELVSNTFEIEWPPHSGSRRLFPEVDRAEWQLESIARRKLLKSQVNFLDRLLSKLKASGVEITNLDDTRI